MKTSCNAQLTRHCVGGTIRFDSNGGQEEREEGQKLHLFRLFHLHVEISTSFGGITEGEYDGTQVDQFWRAAGLEITSKSVLEQVAQRVIYQK